MASGVKVHYHARISNILKYKTQGNRTLQFALAVHSRHPFPPIGDAAYREHARGGPSHGHKQHAQKIGKDRACGSADILADRQTHRQTDRRTHHNTSEPLPRAK